MSIEAKEHNGAHFLEINDELTIYTAAMMKQELQDVLSKQDELEISLECVSDIDSAGIQILILLHQQAKKKGKTLRFIKHNRQVIDVLETLNLEALFGDPIVLPAKEF
ncbi:MULTISPECIES: STAS domain-containing protein [unclassified Motilimonas]|uniref:STAS domain-containing protein n=1 Tax=Motilimonas TaxID=1914248 RepID=UPI001E63D3F9|nr:MULTISPECIES: STAS domain-containing protein [unclassified Motilimonas]MCE0558841.1 STAS domain-containing protein [Motilimonas sp. E26]MDO6526847.1 STAS domain-containing protein [Motilimonas sp. 1_MG-2023]